jgi:hypothetical protein
MHAPRVIKQEDKNMAPLVNLEMKLKGEIIFKHFKLTFIYFFVKTLQIFKSERML